MPARISTFLLVLSPFFCFSQSFSPISISRLPSSFRNSIDWADFDTDGDYDLLITGDSTQLEDLYTEIYRNEGNGRFAPLVNTGLPGLRNSDAVWGDYDNDGDMDIALSGLGKNGAILSKIYENDGTQHFTENTKAELAACFNSRLAWGDYNNDGRLDLLVTGDYLMTGVAEIYTNKGDGVFEELNVTLTGITQAAINWVDINNDGYLDVYTSGIAGNMTSSAPSTKLYLNNKTGGFNEWTNHGIASTYNGSSDWGDYDSDGDLDLVISGGQPFRTKLYKNNGSSFSEVSTSFRQVGEFSSAKFGDFDNDGDLDLLVSGREEPTTDIILSTTLYQNQGNDVFIASSLSSLPTGSTTCNWIDLDYDNDLDLYFFGFSGTPSPLWMGRNDAIPNSSPTVPEGLKAIRIGNQVRFSWRKANDNKTSSQSLTYNLRIGTSPGGQQILRPYANLANGKLRLNQNGNVGLDTSFVLNSSTTAPLYWSVQAIDNSRSFSLFSTEQIWLDQVTDLAAEEVVTEWPLYVTGSKEMLQIHYSSNSFGQVEMLVLSSKGEKVATSTQTKQSVELNASFDLSDFASGIYLLVISEGGTRKTQKFHLP